MAEISAMRLVPPNRPGLCCISYLIFHISGSSRNRENISFSVGKFLIVNGLEYLRGKGTMKLLYRSTIDKMDGRRRKTMKDITYRVEGDHLIPNLVLDDEIGDSSGEN